MTAATVCKVRISCEAISIATCAAIALTLTAFGALRTPLAWMVYSTAAMAFAGVIRLGWILSRRRRRKIVISPASPIAS